MYVAGLRMSNYVEGAGPANHSSLMNIFSKQFCGSFAVPHTVYLIAYSDSARQRHY